MSYTFSDESESYGPPPPRHPEFFGVVMTPIRVGLVIGVVGFVAVGALAWFQLRPLLGEIREVEADVQQKNSQLQAANQAIASLEGIDLALARAQILNARVSSLLPTPDSLRTQLLEVNRLVSQGNASLEGFSPTGLVPSGPEVPAAIQPQIQRSTARVELSGSYADSISLMQNIERLATLFQVNDLALRIQPDSDRLTAEFSLDAYVYDASIPPAPVTPAAGEEEAAS